MSKDPEGFGFSKLLNLASHLYLRYTEFSGALNILRGQKAMKVKNVLFYLRFEMHDTKKQTHFTVASYSF